MRVARRRVQSRRRGSEVAIESPDTQLNGFFLEEFAFSTLSRRVPMREWGGGPPILSLLATSLCSSLPFC